ncbi:MAG TPA: tetratricopeptide repeat protein [Bryobacteraceae bacterium]|nr:tetratricopeptide repeat protein [Bryobacteraceae bacterium]
MSRFASISVCLFAVMLQGAAEERPAIREALTALEHGDFAAAERTLRPDVQAHPSDAGALTLLGVALDHLGKMADAEEFHRRAMAASPRSVDVLNNYASHLVGVGNPGEARAIYLQVLAIDGAQFNANLQLARFALMQKNGADALVYLKHLAPSQQDASSAVVVRLAALDLSGDRAAADALAARLSVSAGSDLGANFSVGLALANMAQFERAEVFFTKALAAAPSDFNILVNLGVVASHAGHNERGREVLEAALRQQPQNVDVLYNLALVDAALQQTETALRLAAQAARLAPRRADVQKLVAITTGDLGALEDAAAAWDRYVKLAPDDDSGRRERGYTAIQMGKFEQGMPDLEWFVAGHPDDPTGQFELGEALSKDDPAKGLAHLDRAIELKPDFPAAHAFRGSLYYQSGQFDDAAKDFETAAAQRPDDAAILDRLGQAYSSLERSADAVRVLRRAAELAPNDSKTILHFARALADAGQTAESKAVTDRFRQLGPVTMKPVRGGLVDYLALTPEQRRADYRARVEKAARQNPGDATAQINLLRVQMEDGQFEQATAQAERITGIKTGPGALAEVELDWALATFRAKGAAEGLARLDKIPEAERSGDFYLARSQMLDASGRPEDAAAALEQALKRAPARVDLYQQATAFLIGKERYKEALALLDGAVRTSSQNRDLLLMRAVSLELAGRTADAEKLLSDIQSRWPEWHAVWVARGLVQVAHGHAEEGRKSLETAVTLGAGNLAGQDLRGLFLRKSFRDW